MQIHQLEANVRQRAYQEMWFDPHDDKQTTIVPKRLNKIIGDVQNVNLHYINYTLPDNQSRYVLYDIGPYNASALGIEDSRYVMLNWQTLEDFARDNELFIQCHIKQRMLPLSTVFIKRTNKGTLLLAVKELPNRTLLQTKAYLYLRFFSNDWIQETVAGQQLDTPIDGLSAYAADITDVGPVLTRFKNGVENNTYLFHNGFLVNDISIGEIAVGDTLQLLTDKSGLGYKDYYVDDLPTFLSTLDGMNKLFLQLDFFTQQDVVPADEVDIFLCNAQSNVGVYQRIKGIYFSRIFRDDIRQVTHQDISINSQRIAALLHEHSGDMVVDKPFLRVYFRQTTERKKTMPLADGQYTLDLYLAEPSLRRNLMVGAASTNTLWKAAVLEQSPYITWQSSEVNALTDAGINGVYSAEELSRRLLEAENPLIANMDNTRLYYTLPECVDINAMVLCYDSNGLLVDAVSVTNKTAGSQIEVIAQTETVRVLPGSFVSDASGFDRDTNAVDSADVYNECFYYRAVDDLEWLPAKEGVNYDTNLETGERVWKPSHSEDGRMRRSIRDAVYREWDIDPELLYYPLSLYEVPPPTLLMLSHTEVYLDGHYLVEGVDYLLANGELTITNKMYFLDVITDGKTLHLKVFHYGLPVDGFARTETGFIQHRRFERPTLPFFISHRHCDVWVDGLLADNDTLAKVEDTASVMDETHREGGIYTLASGLMALSEWARARLCRGDNGEMGQLSANTLGNYLPEPEATGPVFIPYAHAIYSPFVYRIIQRMRSGEIDVAKIGNSRSAVALAFAPYTQEREEDIINASLDWNMVNVHPCPANEQISVTEDEYQFLVVANEVYFHSRLQFNSYFNII